MRSRSIHKYVAHRGGLPKRVQKLRPDPTLFERIGGRETIERIVDGLYDGIENDPTIRPMFISKLEGERVKQKDFFRNGSAVRLNARSITSTAASSIGTVTFTLHPRLQSDGWGI